MLITKTYDPYKRPKVVPLKCIGCGKVIKTKAGKHAVCPTCQKNRKLK